MLVEVRDLPDEALIDDIRRLARSINRMQAAYLARLEVLDRRGGVAAEHGTTGAWLRAELNVSPTVAGRDIHLARDLTDVLPATGAKLAAGDISVAHTRVIASLRRDLDDDHVRAADPHLAEAATSHTPHELLGFVTHVRHAYRPQAVADAERDAHDERELHAASTLGGLGVGGWSADPVSHELIMTAIHAASAPQAGDLRTARQRRFDGLTAICENYLRPVSLFHEPAVEALPRRPMGVRGPVVRGSAISEPASVGAERISGPRRPPEYLPGKLDSSRAARTFTTAQRRAIIARDRHCRWPHCDRPSAWCDTHHTICWAHGGSTSVDNAILLCPRHHAQLHRDNCHVIIHNDSTRTINTLRESARRFPGTAWDATGTDPPGLDLSDADNDRSRH